MLKPFAVWIKRPCGTLSVRTVKARTTVRAAAYCSREFDGHVVKVSEIVMNTFQPGEEIE